MTILSRTFLAATSLAIAAQAVPKVTPVPTDTYECEAFPKSAWNVQVDQCTNSTTEEPCEIEGFLNNAQALSGDWDGYSGLGQGIISIVADENAETDTLECMVGSRGVTMLTVNATGDSLGMYDIDGADLFAWGGPGEINIPDTYNHVDEDGKEQEGVFLGVNNQTTWAVKYHGPNPDCLDDDPKPYYALRMLNGGDLEDGESETFIKISGS